MTKSFTTEFETSLENERLRIIALAKAQGISLASKISFSSIEQLAEIEQLVLLTKTLWNDPKLVTEPFKILSSLPNDLSMPKALAGGVAVKGIFDLFKESVIPVAKKSYNDLQKIREKGTPYDFLKQTLECAGNMFFAFKGFREEAHKTYPGLIALESLLAVQFVGAYAAIGTLATVISTIALICGFKDKTKEIIEDAKKLEEEVTKTKAAAMELQNENTSQHTSEKSMLNNATDLSSVVSKLTEILPKSIEDIPALIINLIPNIGELTEKQQVPLVELMAKLAESVTEKSNIKRFELVSAAIPKFVQKFEEVGGKASEAVQKLSQLASTASTMHKAGELMQQAIAQASNKVTSSSLGIQKLTATSHSI